MNQLQRTISSVEVAKMVGRTHNEVLKDLRKIICHLGLGENPQSYESTDTHGFFTESTYRNSQNKEQPCFLLSKKGCELYSTRMTGAKGTQFAVAYIERFNKMEEHIKTYMTPEQMIIAQAQSVQELKGKVDDIEHKLDSQMTLDFGRQRRLQRAIASRVYALACEQAFRAKLFRELHREVRDRFACTSYKDVRQQDFQQAVSYIEHWVPRRAVV